MTQVPSTQTYADTHAKIKSLREEISSLKSEKELSMHHAENLSNRVKDISEQKDILVKKVNVLSDVYTEAIKESDGVVVSIRGAINEGGNVMREYLSTLENISKKIERETIELDSILKQKEEAHLFIVKEKETLDFYKKDLDIYKSRLAKIISTNNLKIKLL